MENTLANVGGTDLQAMFDEVFNPESLADDLTSGAGGGFQVISIRGSKWRVKAGGEEHPILNEEGEPVPSIEVVLLKGNKNVSKIYYEKKYSEGDDEPPTCMSLDGLKPDTSSVSKQSDSCTTCRHNVWGSRITEAGKKAKECADNRRVAVWLMTPCAGIDENEPILLRVPAASINDLATYGSKMAAGNFPYNKVVTRIGFDLNAAYPKLTFKGVRPITDEEAHKVVAMVTSTTTATILSTAQEVATPSGTNIEAKSQVEFIPEAAPEKEAAKVEAIPKKKAAKKKKKAAEPAPDTETTALDGDLDNIISDLENLA
jgi:hypothetical protein